MKIDQNGVFIGLVNLPMTQEDDFIEKYISNIFKLYRENLARNTGTKLKKELYKPIPYVLFGNFDLGILSLVDDNLFGFQKFKPNSEILNNLEGFKDTSYDFNYQVINCYKCYHGEPKNSLINLFNELFLKENKNGYKYPFISITTLKIKNSLLIGCGSEMTQLINKTIDTCLNDDYKDLNKKNTRKIKYLVLETNSWHELVVILLADNVDVLTNKLEKITELNNFDLYKCDPIIHDNLIKRTLIHQKSNSQNITKNLFSASYSYLGVNYNLLKNRSQLEKLNPSKVNLSLKWFVKPAYRDEIISAVNQYIDLVKIKDVKNEKTSIIFGNGDIEFDFFNDYRKVLKYYAFMINSSHSQNQKHIEIANIIKETRRKTNSTPKLSIKPTSKIKNFTTDNIQKAPLNFDIFQEKNVLRKFINTKFIIPKNKIIIVDTKLCECNISKSIRQRIFKMINNYNNGIEDSILYIYFIDLKPIVEEVIEFINYIKDSELDSHEVHSKLNTFADIFDRAYRNRIHHSNRTLELTDFSLEFNGGIQQIISSYDSVFKLFRDSIKYNNRNELRSNSSPYIAYVSGEPGIFSSINFVQLNIFHLIQPEGFISTIYKEAINHYNSLNGFDHQIIKRAFHFVNSHNELGIIQIINDECKKYSYDPTLNIEFVSNLKIKLFNCLNNHFGSAFTKHIELELVKFITDSNKIISQNDLVLELSYIGLINDSMYDYFLMDQLNLINFYLLDLKLYSKWFWIQYLQEPLTYNNDGTLNEDKLCKAMLRMHFTSKLISNIKNKDLLDYFNLTNIDTFELIKNDQKLNQYYLRHKKSMTLFVDILFNKEIEFVSFFNFSCFDIEYLMSFINIASTTIPCRAIKDKYINLFNELLIKESHYNISNIIFEHRIKSYSYFELIGLFQAYLSIIAKNINNNHFFANRNRFNGQIYSMVECNSGIYIDPHGGLFITKKFRSKYFILQTILHKIIIHYSYQNKIKYK